MKKEDQEINLNIMKWGYTGKKLSTVKNKDLQRSVEIKEKSTRYY